MLPFFYITQAINAVEAFQKTFRSEKAGNDCSIVVYFRFGALLFDQAMACVLLTPGKNNRSFLSTA